MKYYTLYIISILMMFSCAIRAQENAVFVTNIKTLQVKPNGTWGEAPLMRMNSNQFIEISFDDLKHNFQRYTYKLIHCNSDWTPSDLNRNEYMDGFDDNRLEDYEQSVTTMMEYNHYTLTLPNEDVRMLVSGNYIVEIFEDGDDDPVAKACFSVIEPKVNVDISVSSNTDIDTYTTHQQVSFAVNYKGMAVRNPATELLPVVVQNRRWDNHRSNLTPSYMPLNQIVFDHNKALIFDAGAEYRRFEILDRHVPTMRVDKMRFDGDYYHAFLYEDEQRTAYLYDKDQDGRYWIRNGENVDNETESDYFMTHFTLKMPQLSGGKVYVNGELTNNRIAEEYEMEYNMVEHCYEIVLPLKQGSYNYQYLYVRDGENVGFTAPCEGDYHQTENEYYVYVYYREFGERYDRLVGFQQIKTNE